MRFSQDNQNSSNPSKRIASLDFQRGVAIWLMTFLHGFEHVYDYNWMKNDPEAIFNLPKIVLLIGLIVGFFASWNAYFLLISSIVNSLSMTKKAAYGQDPRSVLGKQIITGFSILVIGCIVNSFGYGGYFGMAIRTGNWRNVYPIWSGFFAMYTLQIIGWCIIFNGLIHYLLMRNNGYERYHRNMFIYLLLALFVIIMSPFIHNWVDNMNWKLPTYIPPEVGIGDNMKWPSVHFQANNASFKSWFFSLIAGDLEPLFPYLATSFIGSMVGLSLAKPKPHRRFPLVGGVISILLMALGGMFILLGFLTLGNNRPALGNYLLMLGGQLGVVFLLLRLVEFRGKGQEFANRRFVKHFRLWGMASLSIFSLAIFGLLPRWILGSLYNLVYSSDANLLSSSIFSYGEENKALTVAIVVIISFELLVYLWSRINFKYGFEWIVIRLQSLNKKHHSSRLNVDLIINKMEWENFKYKPERPEIPIPDPSQIISIKQ
ncbi:MAG: hypothetical protein FK732_07405 [Asgard group archaeon]|nr:hypothetical protein [Asgard group archaeon]